jgi:hypothetical protein
MATHPVPPDAPDGDEGADTGAPNPSRLPVEPEFGPLPPASEPEDPHGRPPPI